MAIHKVKIRTSVGYDLIHPETETAAVVGLSSALSTINSNVAGKEPTIAAATPDPTLKYWRGDKTWQTFAHNHNASDVNAGVLSTAQIPMLPQSKITNLATDFYTKTNIQNDSIAMRNARVNANGVPTTNLGDPTFQEMALFQEQFDNKFAFYDISKIKFYTSNNATTWTEYTSLTDQQKRKFVGGDGFARINIPNLTPYFRIEADAVSYVYLNALYMYFESDSHSFTIKIWKKRCDNGIWYQHTNSDALINNWPGHLYMPFSAIPFHNTSTSSGHYNAIRVEIVPTWASGAYSTNPIILDKLQLWGGYPAGKRTIYGVDENKVVSFPAAINANGQAVVLNNDSRLVTPAEKATWNGKEPAIAASATDPALKYWRGDKNWAVLPTTLPASDVHGWAKAENKPSYTQDEVTDGVAYVRVTPSEKNTWSGKAAGTHPHGNIGTGGAITSALVTPATNDCILISDATNSGKIERGIAIDSTHGNAFLRKDGTWAVVPLTASDVGALSTSGGTVSGDITLSPAETTQADQKAIKWKPIASRNPYFGYALDQTDGTFVWSITGTNYASGLAIGGGSGNLLYKGGVVVTANNISSYVTTYAQANSTTLGLLKVHSQANTQTAQTVPAEASKTASRQYSVQLNASGNASVYVPWTTPTVPAFETTATNIKMNGTQAVGTSSNVPRADHVHPVDTSREPANANIQTHVTGTHAPTGAQVNVLEGVQVIGTDLTISSKKVNIPYASATVAGVIKISVSGTTVNIITS